MGCKSLAGSQIAGANVVLEGLEHRNDAWDARVIYECFQKGSAGAHRRLQMRLHGLRMGQDDAKKVQLGQGGTSKWVRECSTRCLTSMLFLGLDAFLHFNV